MRVICIDDSNLPKGAEVKAGQDYEVQDDFNNLLDQRTFILKGIVNEGMTDMGMQWRGYKAERFSPLSDEAVEFSEVEGVEIEEYVL